MLYNNCTCFQTARKDRCILFSRMRNQCVFNEVRIRWSNWTNVKLLKCLNFPQTIPGTSTSVITLSTRPGWRVQKLRSPLDLWLATRCNWWEWTLLACHRAASHSHKLPDSSLITSLSCKPQGGKEKWRASGQENLFFLLTPFGSVPCCPLNLDGVWMGFVFDCAGLNSLISS